MRRARLTAEIWLPIQGFPQHYQISSYGRVRHLPYVDARGWRRAGKIMAVRDAVVFLTVDGRSHWCSVGALVLEAFIGPKPPRCRLVRHLNDDRTNNTISNLEWGNDWDNVQDAKRNGRSFASYGRLGKPHSAETKAKISAARRGARITPAHRLALEAGYRKYLEARSHG